MAKKMMGKQQKQMHKMKNGMMMKDAEMGKMMGKGKKATPKKKKGRR